MCYNFGMSKRRLENIFKRKFAFLKVKGSESAMDSEETKKEWVKSQLRDFSRLGGELVVMKMGN